MYMNKLTMVSIVFHGIRKVMFVMLPYINGKAIVSQELINGALADLGCTERGMTYSIS
jgi:hypothetical protein